MGKAKILREFLNEFEIKPTEKVVKELEKICPEIRQLIDEEKEHIKNIQPQLF